MLGSKTLIDPNHVVNFIVICRRLFEFADSVAKIINKRIKISLAENADTVCNVGNSGLYSWPWFIRINWRIKSPNLILNYVRLCIIGCSNLKSCNGRSQSLCCGVNLLLICIRIIENKLSVSHSCKVLIPTLRIEPWVRTVAYLRLGSHELGRCIKSVKILKLWTEAGLIVCNDVEVDTWTNSWNVLICITERNNDCVIYTFISVIKCCCILFIGCTRKRNGDRSACNCVIFLCTLIILGRLDGNKLCFCGIATCFISVKCRCTREELEFLNTVFTIFVCSVEKIGNCESEVIVAQSNHTSVNIRHRNRTV